VAEAAVDKRPEPPPHGEPRTLPWNKEAEVSILGAAMIENSTWTDIALLVTAEDFFRDAHKRIFRGLERLRQESKPLDLVLLKENLEQAGDLEECGGPAYLASLVDGIPRSTNVVYYCEVVREKSRLRSAIFAANKLLGAAYEADESANLVIEAGVTSLLALADTGAVGERSLNDALKAYTDTLVSEKAPGILTGLTDVDSLIGGFERKKLSIVAARPSVGKSSLITSIADLVTARGEPCGYITLEMDDETLAGNLVAAHSKVSPDRVRRRLVDERGWAQVTAAIGKLHDRPLYFVTSANTLTQLSAWARRLREKYGVRLLFLDYIQLMGNPAAKDRQQEVASISRGLKALAKDEDVAMVAVSALGRDAEKRNDKRPHLSDLRESGALEFDADLVMLLFRQEMYTPNDEAVQGVGECIVAKNRGGPVGTVKLAFISEQARWANLAVMPGAQDGDPGPQYSGYGGGYNS
jgi:replicative DNA helicase